MGGAEQYPSIVAAAMGFAIRSTHPTALCEMDGARWVYDSDQLGAIRRDLMTIVTHHAASRQAAMAPYGRMLLTAGAR